MLFDEDVTGTRKIANVWEAQGVQNNLPGSTD